MVNSERSNNAAYFTDKLLITEIIKNISSSSKDVIYILEPSVGVGNFVPLIINKFIDKTVYLDLLDIDSNSILILKELLKKYSIPKNIHISFITDDFLLHNFNKRYDYIIGNPPFYKMKTSDKLNLYKSFAVNKDTSNICSFFLDKAVSLSDNVIFVFPKFLLNTPEFSKTRNVLSDKIECIIDFGEFGFNGVLVETIAIFINNNNNSKFVDIYSMPQKIHLQQFKKYIFDKDLPYWIIYRNEYFDTILKNLDLDKFTVFRDRQITNNMLNKNKNNIRVLKSRNIADNGNIVDIEDYDVYINENTAKKLSIFKFLDNDDVYLTPNMTYNPRVIKKIKGVLVNGSVAILIPKTKIKLSQKQLDYFSSDEYRLFYKIARNYQTRSLNVDSTSVYFYGILKK